MCDNQHCEVLKTRHPIFNSLPHWLILGGEGMFGYYLLIPTLNKAWWTTIDLEPPENGKRRENPIRRSRTLRGALQNVVGDLFRRACPKVDPAQKLSERPIPSTCPYSERASMHVHRLAHDPRLLVHARIRAEVPLPPAKGCCDQGCNAKRWFDTDGVEGRPASMSVDHQEDALC